MKVIAIAGVLIALAVPAIAEVTKGGYPGCVTEDLFDEITNALVKKDERAFEYLMKNGCVMLKAGIPISVLDRTWTGTARIRAYIGDDAVVLWTNIENIAR